MEKYVMLQLAIPDYKQTFYSQLTGRLGADLTIITGQYYFTPAVVTHLPDVSHSIITNYFAFSRRICIQIPNWSQLCLLVSSGTLITEGNPRILSTWALLFLRGLIGKRTVLWMHAWPQAGRSSKSEPLRAFMRRLARGLILYTESQAKEVRKLMPNQAIWVAPNSLYDQGEIKCVDDAMSAPDTFLYSGRLIASKKPGLMIASFAILSKRFPKARLVIVGDGPERPKLEIQAETCGVRGAMTFTGHVSELVTLKNYYAMAICSLSPGAVGLALTQSLFFGVPMIIAEPEQHGPEVEAARVGFNCVKFPAGSVAGLAAAMESMWIERSAWRARAPRIKEDAESRYSLTKMVSGVIAAYRNTPPVVYEFVELLPGCSAPDA